MSTVCFHAQQAVEKYLKSVIILRGIELRKTHDLEALYYLLAEENLPIGLDKLGKLNPYAVTFRYDDTDIELLTRDEAENIVSVVRNWVKEKLENY
ncbi:HEPN domain-containing protein [Candidatus Halobeggiatoa sp. HSG11]|nr:HEPN domain-containing protein [Candidatus Halobeggiatoa sp. HSG11]